MQVLHLHIRLFLLAHLFLERNLYTSGLRGHDYAKYDHVSYEEAMSVAGFWILGHGESNGIKTPHAFVRAVLCL